MTKDANDSNITEMKLLGDIHGKIVFMADDMLGTGGTLLKAMRYLKDQGATKVICAVSLPLFSSSALKTSRRRIGKASSIESLEQMRCTTTSS
ncbi:hypothetical protein MASR2M48_17640 [Spirochaetota bacterium]